jgi:hypothetical protein
MRSRSRGPAYCGDKGSAFMQAQRGGLFFFTEPIISSVWQCAICS